MGFMTIPNAYKYPEFFAAADGPDAAGVFYLEKLHGTSAHVKWRRTPTGGQLTFFSGGEKHATFTKLFDEVQLEARMRVEANDLGVDVLTIYGECYGATQHRMGATYGPGTYFTAFDVLPGETVVNGHQQGWLDVFEANRIVQDVGLEFVWWTTGKCDVATADAERDRPSKQAERNGMGTDKVSEGVVIRPLVERYRSDGARVILKHKNARFSETTGRRPISLDRVAALTGATEIADEWVTAERLEHVLDHVLAAAEDEHRRTRNGVLVERAGGDLDLRDTPLVIREMLEDVKREAGDEVVWTPEANRACATRTAKLFKARMTTLAPACPVST